MTEQKSDDKRTMTEELEMMGSQVMERVQDLIKQGNVRRIVVRTSDDRILLDTTLTVGAVAGGTLALIAGPFVTAIAAIAAIVGKVKVEVIREVTDEELANSKTRVQISSESEE